MGSSTPASFHCPITFDLLRDPVILGTTGHTFERSAITLWLGEHQTDPLTNQPLANRILTPNFALRDAINDFIVRMSGHVIPASELVLCERLSSGSEKEAIRALHQGQPVVVLRLRQMVGTDAEARFSSG